MSIEAMKQALEALENTKYGLDDEMHKHFCSDAIFALRTAIEQAEKQEPMACFVCNEVHAILDADESQIIRDAKDGYPDGRKPRILTLQERVTALCVYASDWKRWCLEKENATPPAAQQDSGLQALNKMLADYVKQIDAAQRQPLMEEEIGRLWVGHMAPGFGKSEINPILFARAIEAAHGITGDKQ